MATTTYQVVRQAPDQYDPNNPGNPVVGVIVYFMTGEGNEGSIFVPQTRYTVKNVHQMVAAQAKIADEVGRIEGSI